MTQSQETKDNQARLDKIQQQLDEILAAGGLTPWLEQFKSEEQGGQVIRSG
jgi:hypothetical protein